MTGTAGSIAGRALRTVRCAEGARGHGPSLNATLRQFMPGAVNPFWPSGTASPVAVRPISR